MISFTIWTILLLLPWAAMIFWLNLIYAFPYSDSSDDKFVHLISLPICITASLVVTFIKYCGIAHGWWS